MENNKAGRGRPKKSYKYGIPNAQFHKKQRELRRLKAIETAEAVAKVESTRLETSISKQDNKRISLFCERRGWIRSTFFKVAVMDLISKLILEEVRLKDLGLKARVTE